MTIHTKCESITKPVGVINPDFTWYISECDKEYYQKAYEIHIYNDNIDFNTGKIESEESVRVGVSGLKLENNTKYYWTVKIYTDEGAFTSDTDWFITGLVNETNLNWITVDEKLSAPLLRKEFTVDKIPEYAVVNVCGLGFFELYINGKKVSDDIMQPVRSDYDKVTYSNLPNGFDYETKKSVYYLSYEVSRYLVEGQNTVVLWLGNGWYREKARATIRGDFDYGNHLKAFLKLSAENLSVETDDTWQYIDSPIIHNNFFSGEIYDATKYNPDFFESGYVSDCYAYEIDPPAARLISQLCPGEKVIRSVKAKNIKEDIFDAGEVVSGFAKIKLKGEKGEKVEIFYSEDFDGEKLDYTSTVGYVEDDINQIQKDVYILNDEDVQVYEPRFVWHTYRYIYIKHSAKVEILDVDSLFVCSAMEKRASFNCSDQSINAIYDMYNNTVLANMHGCTPLDCAHRERLGYTGDGQLSANAAMYNYDGYHTYKKWITDIYDAQDSNSGFVPYTAPYSGGCGGHAWGSGVVTVPWHFYLQYGDKNFLKASIPYIKKWLSYLQDQKDENGFINKHVEGSWCLGDWVMPSKYPWSDPKPEAIKIPSQLVNTAYYVYCVNLYKKICNELKLEVEQIWEKERLECLSLLKNEYVYSDGVFDEQEADVYLLFVNAVENDMADKVLDNLVQKVEKRNYTFNSGMVATELLFKVLDGLKRNDIALKMLKATEYPSFGYMLKNGATSLWETWEGTGARSHTAFTSIGAWYIYGLAGIKPDRGYKTFTIEPYIAKELSFVDVKLETEYGEIAVKWARENETVNIEITVPFNTTATFKVNDKDVVLKCGNHKFCMAEKD